MGECKCLTVRYGFNVYKPLTLFQRLNFLAPADIAQQELITFHGDTLEEIKVKRDEIKKQLVEKWGDRYSVEVWLSD